MSDLWWTTRTATRAARCRCRESDNKSPESHFFDYLARGAPYGPDDGTVAPWAVVASLPFAPEIVFPAIQPFQDAHPELTGEYCFRCSYNPTFPNATPTGAGWTSPYHFGINLGSVCLCAKTTGQGCSGDSCAPVPTLSPV